MIDTTLELVAPDEALHREWLDFLADLGEHSVAGGSIGDDELAAMADPRAFAAWVGRVRAHEQGEGLTDGRVAATSRWAVRDGEIVGVINLRHELTDLLLDWGGHVGYAVRVSARRQGVASWMLGRILGEAAALGINPVLVSCDEDNVGSRRTIEGGGGVYDGSREGKRRYWITIPGAPLGYAVRPLSEAPLRGRLVELRLPTEAEVAALQAGESRPDWAEGFPRQDDLDGMSMRAGAGAPAQVRAWESRLIVRRADRMVVGTIGFFGPPDPSHAAGTVEVGYGLVESARGHGLITDALRLAVPAAEASGATVTAHTAYDNAASRKALLGAGFRQTGERNDDGDDRYVRPRG